MKTLNLYISVMLFAVTLFFVTEHQATALYATYSRISSTVASGNNVYVTWDDSDGNNTYILFRKSQDDGDTFGKSTVIASNVGVAITTRVAVSSNNVYVAWADDPQKGTPHVYIRTSSDYGNTFGSESVLSDPKTICASVTGLAATGSDVYVFYNCYDPGSKRGSIVFRASHDNAATFGKPITLFNGTEIYSNIFLSTAVQGKNIYIVSQSSYVFNHLPEEIFYRKSTDGGDTFSAPADLGGKNVWHVTPQIVASGSHVYVLWRDWYDNNYRDLMLRSSDDYGTSFGAPIKLNTDKQSTEMYNIPFLSVKPDGTVYVSWEEIHHSEGDAQDQLFRESADGGKTFGPESNLTGLVSGGVDLANGGFATDSGQNLYFVWSRQNQPFDTTGAYFVRSQDGGKTFVQKVDLNDYNKNLHDMHPKIIAVSGNSVYVTGDSQDRGREIFFVSSHDNGTTFGRVEDINDFSSSGYTQKQVLSPLAQTRSGIASQNVKCSEDLELVIKSDDRSPACVRHASLARMLSQGWVYGISDVAEETSGRTEEVVTLGDRIPETNGLVPVTATEVTRDAKSLDSIKVWDFMPIRHDADNIHKTWDTLPRNYTKFYSVVDGNGTDILDYSRMPYPFMVTAELRTYPAICGSEKVTGEGGHPPVMPIKKGHSIVYAENAEMGLLPDSNGAYSFKFLSLFDTKVEFPRDSHVITNQTETCFLENKIDNYTEAFYTNVSFKTD